MHLSRRRFLKLSSKALTVGLYAQAFGASSNQFIEDGASEKKEEIDKRQKAKHVLTFASPYDTNNWRFSPHMHQELKTNIESFTQGLVFVDIQDKGVRGVGTELTAQVSRGELAGALISVSNLSPAATELDILNIPYWSADNQAYLNLVTSNLWQSTIVDKIHAQQRIEILFHYLPGPRTVTTTRLYNKVIKTPSDIKGVVFRTPSSRVLKVFYDLLQAHAVQVKWGDTSKLAQRGRFEALDPGIIGLYNGPNNLNRHLGTVSLIDSVHDGWVAVISQQWMASLPVSLRLAVRDAAAQTFVQHIDELGTVTKRCTGGLKQLGTRIYQPTEQELDLWQIAAGYQHPRWSAVKREILGDERLFYEFLTATKENNGFYYR